MMKYFFAASLLAHFVTALANSSEKLAGKNNDVTKNSANHSDMVNSFYAGKNDNDLKKAQFDMINNYYAGPHCKKIEHQLAEIKQEVRALKENQTSTSEKGLSSEMKQQFAEIKQEIRAFKKNQTGGARENGLPTEMKQQFVEIKQEIRALKENLTGCSGVKGL